MKKFNQKRNVASVKDFELIALCIVLDIDFSELKSELENDIEKYA